MLTELAVWALVVGSLSVLMERIRGQARLARSDSLTRSPTGARSRSSSTFRGPT
jgi:hypothetical protein